MIIQKSLHDIIKISTLKNKKIKTTKNAKSHTIFTMEFSADKSIQCNLLAKFWRHEKSSIVLAIWFKEPEKIPTGTPAKKQDKNLIKKGVRKAYALQYQINSHNIIGFWICILLQTSQLVSICLHFTYVRNIIKAIQVPSSNSLTFWKRWFITIYKHLMPLRSGSNFKELPLLISVTINSRE